MLNNYNENLNNNYNQAAMNDIANWIIKMAICNFIVKSVPKSERNSTQAICDTTSFITDCINPPKTDVGRSLSIATNWYNMSKYL